MYQENVPCRFRTRKGSRYVVGARRVRREGYDGAIHENPKNVFYVEKIVAKGIVKVKRTFSRMTVRNDSGNWFLTFFDDGNNLIGRYNLQREPQIGLSPVDMMLEEDGGNAGTHRLHVGHTIVELSGCPSGGSPAE